MGVLFTSDTFQLLIPWPRRSGDVGPTLPNVYWGGSENTDVLNQRLGVRSEPGSRAEVPLLFGREPAPKHTTLDELVMAVGKPSCRVVIPLNCHPVTRLFTTAGV